MAPRRKKMMSLKGRVQVVKTEAVWDNLIRKCANRFLIVHFGAVGSQSSKLSIELFPLDQSIRSSGHTRRRMHMDSDTSRPTAQAWCMPCKKMKPIFTDLSRKADFNALAFAEVDVDQLQVLLISRTCTHEVKLL